MKKFLITLFSLFLYITCQNPSSPPNPEQPPIPQGMGSFTLRIAGVETRTILPDTQYPSNALQSYKLIFSLNGTGPAIEHTITSLFTPVFLEAGTYTLRVIGYTDTAWQKPAAEGSPSPNSIVIEQGGATSCAVTLKAYGIVAATEGAFSWNITFPNNVTASMTIEPLSGGTSKQTVALPYNASSLTLASGYYQITIELAKTNFQNVIWYEILHVYQNMTSHFEHEFTDDDFTKNKYTITFNYNDDVTPQGKQTRAYGQKAADPVPTRAGYNFDGWYNNTGFIGTAYNFDTEITGNLNLYAQWLRKLENAVITVTSTHIYNKTPQTPTYTVIIDTKNLTAGTHFTASYANNINAGTAAITITGVNSGGYTGTATQTFTINKADGATVNAPTLNTTTHNSITINTVSTPSTEQDIEYGISTSNNANTVTWQSTLIFNGLTQNTTYYIFARAVGNGNYETGMASGSLTVTTLQTVALNRIEYYWVDQHGSLATTSNGAITIASGETLIITAQGDGYVVQQWHLNGVNTGQNGITYNFSSMAVGKHTVGLFVQKDGKLYNTNITITVVYTVSFNANGATSGTAPAARSVNLGSSTTLPSGSGLTRSGYTFGGWNTNTAGTGTNYNAGVYYTPTAPAGNIILYARWTPLTRTVIINMYDSYGDGWDGNGALRIVVNGTQVATGVKVQTTAANNTPSGQRDTNTYTFSVSTGDVVQLYWVAGSSQYENSFIVYYADTPPSPAFTTSNNNNWNGNNALVYRLRTTSGTTGNNFLTNTANDALLGSFTVQ